MRRNPQDNERIDQYALKGLSEPGLAAEASVHTFSSLGGELEGTRSLRSMRSIAIADYTHNHRAHICLDILTDRVCR